MLSVETNGKGQRKTPCEPQLSLLAAGRPLGITVQPCQHGTCPDSGSAAPRRGASRSSPQHSARFFLDALFHCPKCSPSTGSVTEQSLFWARNRETRQMQSPIPRSWPSRALDRGVDGSPTHTRLLPSQMHRLKRAAVSLTVTETRGPLTG